MSKSIIILFFLLSSSVSMSKSLIISDIDDTIKRSHILGNKVRALRMKSEFTGLSDLYNSFICHKEKSVEKREFCRSNRGLIHSEERWISYVTGAPGRLQLLGREFLSLVSYPQGVVKGKKSFVESTHDFKKVTISKILKNTQMNEYILIGDNGEHDPLVYSEVRKAFPNKKVFSYIHEVYSINPEADEVGKKLESGQIPYLTAADLALHFYRNNWISVKDLTRITNKVLSTLRNSEEFENVIPSWFRCVGYDLNNKIDTKGLSEKLSRKLFQVGMLTEMRCREVLDD